MSAVQVAPFARRLGYLKDPPNPNDRRFATIRSPFKDMAVANDTEDYEINDGAITIFDQGQEDSCVANAWIADLMILLYLQTGLVPDMLSRQFVYWTARCVSQQQTVDGGTFLRNGAQALSTTGVCTEQYFPYNPSMVLTSPPEAAFFNASNNLLLAGGYYSVTDLGEALCDDLETAIKANHPPVFGTQVGQDFMNYFGSNMNPNYIFDAPTANIAGGHALLLAGVRRVNGNRQFKVRNSWSDQWGINGYAWFSEEYLMNNITNDFWVGTQMKLLAS